MNNTILIVDDEEMITTTLSSLIKLVLKYNVIVSNDPLEVIENKLIEKYNIDLVISDFLMPKMNGIKFLEYVKKINPEIITILLTGYADKESAIKSINRVGIYYYLEKPWDNNTLIKVIKNGLEKKRLSDELNKKIIELERSHHEVSSLYELQKKHYHNEVENMKGVIMALANVIEAKDKYTEGHARRVAYISKKLGQKSSLSKEQLENLEIAGIIHDIGKVGVSDSILNKPGKLTNEEFNLIKKHTVIGEMICKPLNCLKNCIEPIRHHHEKLDGSGYPDGIKSNKISIETRILTVADIFDALYSDRPYRNSLPLEKVRYIMFDEVHNNKLDGNIVKLLFEMIDNKEITCINEKEKRQFIS